MKMPLIAGIAGALVLCLSPYSVAADVTNDKTDVTAEEEVTVTPSNKMDAAQVKIASDAALSIMKEIATARSEIHKRNIAAAKEGLRKAETLVDIIRDQEPTFRVKDRIWIAKKHLDYEDTEHVTNDLVPIFGDLTFVEGFVPTQDARTHLNRAKDALRNGNKADAGNELQLAGDSLTFMEVDLPLAHTEDSIRAASRLLTEKKIAAADSTLKTAEGALVVTMDALTPAPGAPVVRKGKQKIRN